MDPLLGPSQGTFKTLSEDPCWTGLGPWARTPGPLLRTLLDPLWGPVLGTKVQVLQTIDLFLAALRPLWRPPGTNPQGNRASPADPSQQPQCSEITPKLLVWKPFKIIDRNAFSLQMFVFCTMDFKPDYRPLTCAHLKLFNMTFRIPHIPSYGP